MLLGLLGLMTSVCHYVSAETEYHLETNMASPATRYDIPPRPAPAAFLLKRDVTKTAATGSDVSATDGLVTSSNDDDGIECAAGMACGDVLGPPSDYRAARAAVG